MWGIINEAIVKDFMNMNSHTLSNSKKKFCNVNKPVIYLKVLICNQIVQMATELLYCNQAILIIMFISEHCFMKKNIFRKHAKDKRIKFP